MPYRALIHALLGRALSRLDAEPTSPSRGSFDRTWWCWKFTDFSAARFQEGVHLLAWLATSPQAPEAARRSARPLEEAGAALQFWTRLQHRDGSFDEAYPFERSLAATAFTGFYVGCALERLRDHLDPPVQDAALKAVSGLAGWLEANGEYHGVLSNHLAAAAGALQLAGDLLGSDRFRPARDRYLGIIYREQDPDEGWMREYGGADPGYQSHGMFYLAEIERRCGDAELLERLDRAARFLGWFCHPDGTIGGEYASRGTKFAYPAAFEMLAPRIPAAAAIAAHLRGCLAAGRGVGGLQMDAWNLFPLLNNYLFAADAAPAAGGLADAPPLPWRTAPRALFPRAGLVVARAGGRVLAAGPGRGGAVKLWQEDGRLIYEDCGYALVAGQRAVSSQTEGDWSEAPDAGDAVIALAAASGFRAVPATRFTPWTFGGFRLFMLSLGRMPLVARWLKDLLVRVLIRRRPPHPARLERLLRLEPDGTLTLVDRVTGTGEAPRPLPRAVPIHMGSARYADAEDWFGALIPCPPLQRSGDALTRRLVIPATGDAA